MLAMSEKKKKIPQKVLNASKFLATIKDGSYTVKQSDEVKISEAKLILAVYGCQKEKLPVTVSNLIIILGQDAPTVLQVLTPELYPQYEIIGP